MLETGMILAATVTGQVTFAPPSLLAAVMVAVPGLTAVTIPSSTLAIPASDVLQITVLSVALSGATVALSLKLSPSVIDSDSELSVKDDTLISTTGSSHEVTASTQRSMKLRMVSLFIGKILNPTYKGTIII